MDKIELVERIRSARTRWDTLLASIDPAEFEQAGVVGEWSLKDLIAHLAWFEREITRMLRARSYSGASQWWSLPQDERNAEIYTLNRSRLLNEVLADAQGCYQDVIAAIATITDSDLADPSQFIESPPGAQPWQIIAQNTYEHYTHHARDVEAWLAAQRV